MAVDRETHIASQQPRSLRVPAQSPLGSYQTNGLAQRTAEVVRSVSPRQGNRISDLSEHGGEEGFAQGSAPDFFAKRSLGGITPDQVECHVTQDGEVLRRMVHAAA